MAIHTDPVCGMKVDDQKGKPHSTYRETTYHFCGDGCKAKFDENPQQYAQHHSGK
jgi:Cu+-exporting ATPase